MRHPVALPVLGMDACCQIEEGQHIEVERQAESSTGTEDSHRTRPIQGITSGMVQGCDSRFMIPGAVGL